MTKADSPNNRVIHYFNHDTYLHMKLNFKITRIIRKFFGSLTIFDEDRLTLTIKVRVSDKMKNVFDFANYFSYSLKFWSSSGHQWKRFVLTNTSDETDKNYWSIFMTISEIHKQRHVRSLCHHHHLWNFVDLMNFLDTKCSTKSKDLYWKPYFIWDIDFAESYRDLYTSNKIIFIRTLPRRLLIPFLFNFEDSYGSRLLILKNAFFFSLTDDLLSKTKTSVETNDKLVLWRLCNHKNNYI